MGGVQQARGSKKKGIKSHISASAALSLAFLVFIYNVTTGSNNGGCLPEKNYKINRPRKRPTSTYVYVKEKSPGAAVPLIMMGAQEVIRWRLHQDRDEGFQPKHAGGSHIRCLLLAKGFFFFSCLQTSWPPWLQWAHLSTGGEYKIKTTIF